MGTLGGARLSGADMAMTANRNMRVLILVGPALLLLAVGYVVPLVAIFWTSLQRGGALSIAAYGEALGSFTFLQILGRTLWMAATVTLISATLGYPLAYVAAIRLPRLGSLAMALVIVPYLTSILIRSYSWIAILSGDGLVNGTLSALDLIGSPLPLVFNRFGSYVGMVHILLPLLILPLYAALRRIDGNLLLAAANLGAGRADIFASVVLPVAAPGLVAGAALVFLAALGFYITPALLGAPGDYLLAQAIEVRISVLGEFDVAAALACLLLGLVAVFLVLLRHHIVPLAEGGREKHRSGIAPSLAPLLYRCGRLATRVPGMTAISGAASAAFVFGTAALTLVFLLAPMIVVVLIAFSDAPYLTFPPSGYSLRWFQAFLGDRRWIDAAWFSLGVSAVAATTTILIGAPLARALATGTFRGRHALWILAISPMILPHIVLGFGLFLMAVAFGMNGRFASFWIAYTVTGLPYAVVILTSAMARFDASLEKAAASLGAPALTVFRTVNLPLLAGPFAAAFLFAFLTGFDDLIISLFLSTPRGTTLAMRMWEDIRLEISPKTAVVGTLQLLMLLIALPFTLRVSGGRRHNGDDAGPVQSRM